MSHVINNISPSDDITVGIINGKKIAFLPRHGQGHRLLPSEIPFRANIYALKLLGVERVISVSAVGGLNDELGPMDIVIPDQIVDRTKARAPTFFGDGIVAHVGFSHPTCPELSQIAAKATEEVVGSVMARGCYLCMEGPAFSTRAESLLHKSRDAPNQRQANRRL